MTHPATRMAVSRSHTSVQLPVVARIYPIRGTANIPEQCIYQKHHLNVLYYIYIYITYIHIHTQGHVPYSALVSRDLIFAVFMDERSSTKKNLTEKIFYDTELLNLFSARLTETIHKI